MIEDKIWNKIKEIKDIKFHSNLVFDEKQIKAKVKEFNGVVNTNFWGDKVPKEDVCHNCIACINIDSVMKMEKNYPQVYLEECKHKVKKKRMSRFIDAQLESDFGSDSE